MLFLIHTLPGEKNVCTTTIKARVFLGNNNFASSLLRVGSVEIIIENVPYVVHAVES